MERLVVRVIVVKVCHVKSNDILSSVQRQLVP